MSKVADRQFKRVSCGLSFAQEFTLEQARKTLNINESPKRNRK
jgi:hypothetical protein